MVNVLTNDEITYMLGILSHIGLPFAKFIHRDLCVEILKLSKLSRQQLQKVWALVDIPDDDMISIQYLGLALRLIAHFDVTGSINPDYLSIPPVDNPQINLETIVPDKVFDILQKGIPDSGSGSVVESQDEECEIIENLDHEPNYEIDSRDYDWFCDLFEKSAKSTPGFISGVEFRECIEDLLKKNPAEEKVDSSELEHLWFLVDIDEDGYLSKAQFIIALDLLARRNSNNTPLPKYLPTAIKFALMGKRPIIPKHIDALAAMGGQISNVKVETGDSQINQPSEIKENIQKEAYNVKSQTSKLHPPVERNLNYQKEQDDSQVNSTIRPIRTADNADNVDNSDNGLKDTLHPTRSVLYPNQFVDKAAISTKTKLLQTQHGPSNLHRMSLVDLTSIDTSSKPVTPTNRSIQSDCPDSEGDETASKPIITENRLDSIDRNDDERNDSSSVNVPVLNSYLSSNVRYPASHKDNNKNRTAAKISLKDRNNNQEYQFLDIDLILQFISSAEKSMFEAIVQRKREKKKAQLNLKTSYRKIHEKKEKLELYSNQLSACQKTFDEVEKELKGLLDEKKKLTLQVALSHSSIQHIQDKTLILKHQCDEVRNEIDIIQQQNKILIMQSDEITNENSNFSRKYKELQDLGDQQRRLLQTAEKDYEETLKSLGKYKQDKLDLTNLQNKVKYSLNETMKDRSTLISAIDQKVHEVTSLATTRAQIERNRASIIAFRDKQMSAQVDSNDHKLEPYTDKPENILQKENQTISVDLIENKNMRMIPAILSDEKNKLYSSPKAENLSQWKRFENNE